MHAGTIEWNGSDLSTIGKPTLTIRRTPDPPPPGFATRTLVSLTVRVSLEAMDPGTLQARMAWLAESMKVPEGILRSSSGSGHALEWLASPGDHNLSDALTGLSNAVELSFHCVENHGDGALTGASFTPAGTSAALALHAVRDIKEEIKTSRHVERNGSRSATTTTLSFTARVAQSNPADSLTTRMAYLQNAAGYVKGLDTGEGALVLGQFNKIVRVTEFTPIMDERYGALDVQVQCYHVTLPDASVAECLYEIDSKLDEGSGETVISISGEIAAETRAIAIAKLNLLREAQNVTGQRITSYSTKDKIIDGKDSSNISNGDWPGAISFTLEVRKPMDGNHYNLKISTQKDIRSGMKWTYSGTVKSTTEAAALAVARGIASNNTHLVMVRSDETIEKVTQMEDPDTLEFIQLSFSYEFEGPSDGFIGGEILTETSYPMYGDWRRTISGFLVAETPAAAEAVLTSLLTSYTNPLEITRKWSETYLKNGGTENKVSMKLDFSCSVRATRTRASTEFTDSTQTTLSTMRQSRTLAGSIWSGSGDDADAALDLLLTSVFGEDGAHDITRTHTKTNQSAADNLNITGTPQWTKLDFSATKATRLTGEVGYDLLDASFSMERTGSINAAIITPIPFDRPVAQIGTGYIPGRISLSATAKALNLGTAKAWVQGKRGLVTAIGSDGISRFETEQPRETVAPEYAPFKGTEACLWSFSGNYGWTIIDASMDGLWTSNLPNEEEED